jgi:hypothetical protein
MKLLKPNWFVWLDYPPATDWMTRYQHMRHFRDLHIAGAILTLCHPCRIHIAWGPDAVKLAHLLDHQIAITCHGHPVFVVPNLPDLPLDCTILHYTELNYTGPQSALATPGQQHLF